MISGAAFCPPPPVLVPDVARGAAAELDDLRAACRKAITRVSDGRQAVLLGAGPLSQSHSSLSRGSLAGYGTAGEIELGAPANGGLAARRDGSLDLSPALTVGAWLVRDALGPGNAAMAFSVGPDFAGSRAALELLELARTRDIALVVLADGSARRSVKAPGYLDGRAEGFDAGVAEALRSGDGAALAALDADLGAQVLAAGVPAWHAAGAVLTGVSYDAELLYEQAPYGVGYFAAAWTANG